MVRIRRSTVRISVGNSAVGMMIGGRGCRHLDLAYVAELHFKQNLIIMELLALVIDQGTELAIVLRTIHLVSTFDHQSMIS